MSTKVVTKKVRFSYAHVWEPKAIEEGQDKKYSASIIISKDDKATLKAVNDAVAKAFEEGKGKFGGKVPKNWKHPLRDGDEDRPDDENYENSYFINASSLRQPQIVDASVNPILDQDEFYSGCFGRASINFYAFNVNGNKGVAAGLNNVQKLEDGPRLGGSAASAEDDFGTTDDLM